MSKYYVITRNENGEKIEEKRFKNYRDAWRYYVNSCVLSGSIEVVTRDYNGNILDTLNYSEAIKA